MGSLDTVPQKGNLRHLGEVVYDAGLTEGLLSARFSARNSTVQGQRRLWKYIMAVLVTVLKIFGGLAAFAVCVIIAILALPISVNGSGSCMIESNIEEALNRLDNYESGEIDLFLVDYGFDLKASVLLGLVSVRVSDTVHPDLRVLGIKVPLGTKPCRVKPGRETPGKPEKPGKAKVSGISRESRQSGTPDTSGQFGKPGKPEKSKTFKKHKRVRLSEIKTFISAPVRPKAIGVIQSLFRAAHLDVDLNLELGLFDPSHTGIVFGLFSAYAGAFGVKGVRLHPNFENQVIGADGRASIWIVPAQLLWIGARFMLAPEIRDIWWRKRKRGKQKPQVHQGRRELKQSPKSSASGD